MRSIVRAFVCIALTGVPLLLDPHGASAQNLIQGFARSDQSDVSGVAVTSSDMLRSDAGVVRSFSCPIAWGVRTASDDIGAELAGQRFHLAGMTPAPAGEALQHQLHAVLHQQTDREQSRAELLTALAPANTSPDARRAAKRLVRQLDGLLSATGRMDPARPGYNAPSQLMGAVAAYNRFLDASSDAYLAQPPEALIAIHTLLGRMVTGAIVNRDRAPSPAMGGGLACAAPAMAAVPMVIPERPISMCVTTADGPTEAFGLVSMSGGDTVSVLNGQRIAFRDAYPGLSMYAADMPGLSGEAPVSVAGERYVRYGLPRVAAPGELRRSGEMQGLAIFRTVRAGDEIYLPVEGGCHFQEYRRARDVTRVRG